MKKILLVGSILISIIAIIIAIIVYNHVSIRISDNEVLIYKSSQFCSSLIQQDMKSPASYQVQEINVIYKKGSDDELKERIPKKNYNLFKLDYEQGKLSLYNFYTLIKYSAKNSFDVKLENYALCEFSVIHAKNYGFYSPRLDALTIGHERHVGADLLILFPKSINPPELNKFSFWEKLTYLFDKNNFSIISE